MKNFLCLLIVFSILSCSKSDLLNDEESINNEDYYLDFDIKNDASITQEQKSYKVKSFQDISSPLTFLNVLNSIHKYRFKSHIPIAKDSVDIIGTIQLNANEDFGFDKKSIHFEIIVREAIANLTILSDSTYTYKSNNDLLDKLEDDNFGQKSIWDNDGKSTIFITMPDADQKDMHFPRYTSTGFIHPYESIKFIDLQYNEEENTIILIGDFEVDLKFISCGIISTHQIENAEFKLKIK